jgi:hypothetical protein
MHKAPNIPDTYSNLYGFSENGKNYEIGVLSKYSVTHYKNLGTRRGHAIHFNISDADETRAMGFNMQYPAYVATKDTIRPMEPEEVDKFYSDALLAVKNRFRPRFVNFKRRRLILDLKKIYRNAYVNTPPQWRY